MKIILLNNPLTSQTIVCSNQAQGISPYVYTYVEQVISVEGTPKCPINEGDVVRGKNATAIVLEVILMGLRVKSSAGEWIADETLSIGPKADILKMVGLPIDCEDDYPLKGKEATDALITVFPRNSTRERNVVLVAMDGSTPDHNSMLGHAIKDGDEIVLNNIDKIKRVRFLEYTAGSRAITAISCSFS